MSDFEDEEGVDEPVLDDENEDEGTEEEEVNNFRISSFVSNVKVISTLLEFRQIIQHQCYVVWKTIFFKFSVVFARFLLTFVVLLETSRESSYGRNASRQSFFAV